MLSIAYAQAVERDIHSLRIINITPIPSFSTDRRVAVAACEERMADPTGNTIASDPVDFLRILPPAGTSHLRRRFLPFFGKHAQDLYPAMPFPSFGGRLRTRRARDLVDGDSSGK
jgi:hypothetical protein